ncbi:MAG: glutamine synthetase family protein [Clostridiales bacterium]|nr:glutamine synthetase family protein [Clostridiales bacterium]
MIIEKKNIMSFFEENDVKFIRLAFSDVFSIQKNISIMPSEMNRAMTTGIHIESTSIEGPGSKRRKDLYLFPDLTTASLLPWRPSSGRVVRFYCDIKYADGSPYELDCRHMLKTTVKDLLSNGLSCTVGAECEFYLFKADEDGNSTGIPFDNGTYLDAEPRDKGQNVRREICLTLENMGVSPESSQHEVGPGQNEIDFRYSDALTSADNVITLKSVVETIAAQNGLFATFQPKPLPKSAGNGFHINLIPYQINDTAKSVKESFIAGILNHCAEMTAFLNPSEESYLRLGDHNAPAYVSWAKENYGQLIRVPETTGGRRDTIELRSPDSCANPYIAYTLLLMAGFEGVKKEMKLDEPTSFNIFEAEPAVLSTLRHLPRTFEEAMEAAKMSRFVNRVLPAELIDIYKNGKPE